MENKMELKARIIILFYLLIFLTKGFSQTDVQAGISISEEGLKSFYFSVSEYYGVPENEVIIVHERKIPDEDLPVVFFIAGRAGVDPKVIIDLRIGGSSWYNISVKYGIYPDVYYIPLTVDPGPPYGKAYGYYKNKPKSKWKKIKLSDEDIINLVNLRFISEHYNYAPEKVIKMRTDGKHFAVINDNVKSEMKGNKNNSQDKSKNNSKKNK
jgi:hypothetical protein